MLGPEQPDGVAGGCPDDRYQDERRAGAGGGVDQAGVAGPVHRGRRDAAGAGETVHGGDNRARALECPGDATRVADVTVNDLDAVVGQVLRPGRVACQHPHGQALFGQAGDQPGAKGAGTSGDDDHRREPGPGSGADPAPARTCWRTAALTSAPPACTGSR